MSNSSNDSAQVTVKSTRPDHEDPEGCGPKAGSCLMWLVLFGLIGYGVMMAVLSQVRKGADPEELQRSHALMIEQMEQIRRGEINCLVKPDPRFFDELLADRECIANIREVYLGPGNLSDPHLGRLRELPNLKCIVFLFSENPDVLLETLRGMATIEELTFDRTFLSRRSIDLLGSFPNLKSLCFPMYGLKASDLQGIQNHRSIERLCLTRAERDEALLPVLQSLPHLHSVTIQVGYDEQKAKSFERSLQNSLSNCACRVEEVER